MKFFLSRDQKELRVKWATGHLHKDWKKIIFSDETTFWLGKSGVSCWKPKNEENIHMVSKNIPKVNLWGAFCWHGKISLKLFTHNLDSAYYVEILEKKLPEMRNLYKTTSGWCYQQDNDPKHTAKITKEWFRKNKVKQLL